MNWYSVGLAAASGALAALITNLIFGNKAEKKLALGVAFAVLFVVFNSLAKKFILPGLNALSAIVQFEGEIKDYPVFHSIKQYEPETYEALVTSFTEAIRKGQSRQQTIDILRSQIMSIVVKRLPKASDEAVTKFIEILIEELNELQNQGGGLCFRYLFPEIDGGIDATKVLSMELMERDLAALDLVIRTYDANLSIPDESEVMPFINPLYAELFEIYGDEISLLQNPGADNTDREKVCDITKALYSKILELEPQPSVKKLRWMLGQT